VLANLSPETREQLLRLGRERGLIYKTLVLTGLRKGELTSITVCQVDLDGRVPSLLLHARDEKNRRGSEIPLRVDLAADIRSWLADRLTRAQQAAREADGPISATLASDEPLFEVPEGLIRIFDRDLVFAGLARIEKRDGKEVVVKTDDRGRTIDVHAPPPCGTPSGRTSRRLASRSGRRRPPCGTATQASRPTSTLTRSCSTWPGRWQACRTCRWARSNARPHLRSHDEGSLSMIARCDAAYPLACVHPFGGGYGALRSGWRSAC